MRWRVIGATRDSIAIAEHETLLASIRFAKAAHLQPLN
jgi:hypothetical protein